MPCVKFTEPTPVSIQTGRGKPHCGCTASRWVADLRELSLSTTLAASPVSVTSPLYSQPSSYSSSSNSECFSTYYDLIPNVSNNAFDRDLISRDRRKHLPVEDRNRQNQHRAADVGGLFLQDKQTASESCFSDFRNNIDQTNLASDNFAASSSSSLRLRSPKNAVYDPVACSPILTDQSRRLSKGKTVRFKDVINRSFSAGSLPSRDDTGRFPMTLDTNSFSCVESGALAYVNGRCACSFADSSLGQRRFRRGAWCRSSQSEVFGVCMLVVFSVTCSRGA